MIKTANDLDFRNKKYNILITGRPGVGKTTLAESAPNPLLIDLENGVDRVDSCYRSDVSTVDPSKSDEDKFYEFINDLTHSDLSKYDTIIVDCLGKFIELATPVVIKENPANAQKDGKTLSLKGYGAVTAKFAEFSKLVKSLNKHIIWISHVTETQDNDIVKTRLSIPGSTKDRIWDDVDLGGYIEFQGKKRIIHFTPSERYDAKGTHSVNGTFEIPSLPSTNEGGKYADNHFLSDLFNKMTEDIIKEKEVAANGQAAYEEAMKLAPKVDACSSVDELNDVVELIKGAQHGLTSKKELLAKVTHKADELGAVYDPKATRYVGKAEN